MYDYKHIVLESVNVCKAWGDHLVFLTIPLRKLTTLLKSMTSMHRQFNGGKASIEIPEKISSQWCHLWIFRENLGDSISIVVSYEPCIREPTELIYTDCYLQHRPIQHGSNLCHGSGTPRLHSEFHHLCLASQTSQTCHIMWQQHSFQESFRQCKKFPLSWM